MSQILSPHRTSLQRGLGGNKKITLGRLWTGWQDRDIESQRVWHIKKKEQEKKRREREEGREERGEGGGDVMPQHAWDREKNACADQGGGRVGGMHERDQAKAKAEGIFPYSITATQPIRTQGQHSSGWLC